MATPLVQTAMLKSDLGNFVQFISVVGTQNPNGMPMQQYSQRVQTALAQVRGLIEAFFGDDDSYRVYLYYDFTQSTAFNPWTWTLPGVQNATSGLFWQQLLQNANLPPHLGSQGQPLHGYSGHANMASYVSQADDASPVLVTPNNRGAISIPFQRHLLNRAGVQTLYNQPDSTAEYFTPNHLIVSAMRTNANQLQQGFGYEHFSSALHKAICLPLPRTCFWDCLAARFDWPPAEIENLRAKVGMQAAEFDGMNLASIAHLDSCLRAPGSRPIMFFIFNEYSRLIYLSPLPSTERQSRNRIYLYFHGQHFYCAKSAGSGAVIAQSAMSYWRAAAQSVLSVSQVQQAAASGLFPSTRTRGDGGQKTDAYGFFTWYLLSQARPAMPNPEGMRLLIEMVCAEHGWPQPAWRRIAPTLSSRSKFARSEAKTIQEGYALYDAELGEGPCDLTTQRNHFMSQYAGQFHVRAEMAERQAEAYGYAAGPKHSAAELFQRRDPDLARRLLETQQILFPRHEFDESDVLVYDIETSSSMQSGLYTDPISGEPRDTSNIFYCYSIGWMFRGEYKSLTVQSAEQLERNEVLIQAVEEWLQIAERLNTLPSAAAALAELAADESEEEGAFDSDETEPRRRPAPQKERRRCLYIYAFNGAGFDTQMMMHAILARQQQDPATRVTTELPEMLLSNGRIISATYKDLKFLDIRLITMGSLDGCCSSFGIKTQKGDFPHRYFQDTDSFQTVIDRLFSHVTWRELDELGVIDYYSKSKASDLKCYDPKRSLEELRQMQPTARAIEAEGWDTRWSVYEKVQGYLRKDVECTYELVLAIGKKFGLDFGVDIKKKMTIGAIGTHVWKATLSQDFQKMTTLRAKQVMERANRGGWTSALGRMHAAADAGRKIYKVDVTSEYPAAEQYIRYVTAAGPQEPLRRYYHGFPFPSLRAPWLSGALRMGVVLDSYEAGRACFAGHYGFARVRVDQSACAFPPLVFLLTHHRSTSAESAAPSAPLAATLAPVIYGEDWFSLPHLLFALDHGAKLEVLDSYTTLGCYESPTGVDSPFEVFNTLFYERKSAADAVRDELKAKAKRGEALTPEEESRRLGAEYDREVAKLFLNALPGRLNIKVDRSQMQLTRDFNDILSLFSDDETSETLKMTLPFEMLTPGSADGACPPLYRVDFRRGSLLTQVSRFDVLPYLSAYMLGYAKCLIGLSFQRLTQLGCELLYTDTDSIAFLATEAQYATYASEFVPLKKSLGGMELEGEYSEFVCIGPKKYAMKKFDGTCEWAGNGIRADKNVALDMWDEYSRILRDDLTDEERMNKGVKVDHFTMTKGKSYSIKHMDLEKRVRICPFKGRLVVDAETGVPRIGWWETQAQFGEAVEQFFRDCRWQYQS